MSLWPFFQSDKDMRSPQKRTHIIPKIYQRASFCICQKASYTLEAAVVIPLLAGYFVTLLSFFQILQIQCAVDEALLYAGRKTAVESSIVDSEEALFVSAEGFLLYALKDNSLIEDHVVYGMLGIHLWESEFDGEAIVLKADYAVKLPIGFLGIKQVELTSQNRFQKWNGEKSGEDDGEWVYVTPNGVVYHADIACRSLNLSIKFTSLGEIEELRGLDGQKYYECSLCDWEDDRTERVYYTDYGVLYHKNISCSFLKRTIEKISIEEIGDRRPCSFCSES